MWFASSWLSSSRRHRTSEVVALTHTPARPQPGPGGRTLADVAERVAHVVASALSCDRVDIVLTASADDPVVVSTADDAPTAGPRRVAQDGTIELDLPLRGPARDLGVLHLSLDAAAGTDPATTRLVHDVAALAEVTLSVAGDRDDLRRAVDTRGIIGVAMGILVERYDLAPDAAFQVLVRHSQFQNRKLRDIATALVEDGTLPGLETDQRERGDGSRD